MFIEDFHDGAHSHYENKKSAFQIRPLFSGEKEFSTGSQSQERGDCIGANSKRQRKLIKTAVEMCWENMILVIRFW